MIKIIIGDSSDEKYDFFWGLTEENLDKIDETILPAYSEFKNEYGNSSDAYAFRRVVYENLTAEKQNIIYLPEVNLRTYEFKQVFAEYVKKHSKIGHDIVLITNSPTLLSFFDNYDEIELYSVYNGKVNKIDLINGEISDWLDDYDLGYLWTKTTLLKGD